MTFADKKIEEFNKKFCDGVYSFEETSEILYWLCKTIAEAERHAYNNVHSKIIKLNKKVFCNSCIKTEKFIIKKIKELSGYSADMERK